MYQSDRNYLSVSKSTDSSNNLMISEITTITTRHPHDKPSTTAQGIKDQSPHQ